MLTIWSIQCYQTTPFNFFTTYLSFLWLSVFLGFVPVGHRLANSPTTQSAVQFVVTMKTNGVLLSTNVTCDVNNDNNIVITNNGSDDHSISSQSPSSFTFFNGQPDASAKSVVTDSVVQPQPESATRLYRSNSLITILAEDIDDSSSNSSSSNTSVDLNCNATNHANRTSDRSFGHSYPHSDTESYSESANITDAGSSRKKLTVLLPFNDQVGGHTQLMLLDQSTLCKPLVQRELLFYLNIPRELQSYVPHYKGKFRR